MCANGIIVIVSFFVFLPKKLFNGFRVAFLEFSLPLDVQIRVLTMFSKSILVNVQHPQLLSGFLMQAFEAGGARGMLALEPLLSLIMHYNLDYPKFFPHLYSLLSPSIFTLPSGNNFITMLGQCLHSVIVPGARLFPLHFILLCCFVLFFAHHSRFLFKAYTLAAFVKRLARICLYTGPHGYVSCAKSAHSLSFITTT